MTSVPLVSVFSADDSTKVTAKHIPLPAVFQTPIRPDIVSFVHTNIAKNRRQAHAVNPQAGMQHSAESWGTGRAVARIPRVSGSGTHRSGQAAFGNQCRKGRMSLPIKVWRRWHRRVNIKQKRHAAATAVAATGIVPLVLARGHRISQVPQIPLVVEDKIESYEKTTDALNFLKRFGAFEDVQKVVSTKVVRAGISKQRGKKYRVRKGPLVVYFNENAKLLKAFRNVPGVEVVNVTRLNLLQLAPGGQLGRFVIWTQSAFAHLDKLFGTYRYASVLKDGYQLLRPLLTNPDLARIINSNQVQEKVQPAKTTKVLHDVQKKNPLKNTKAMDRLNPYAKKQRAAAVAAIKANTKGTKKIKKNKALKKASKAAFNKVAASLSDATKAAVQEEQDIKVKYFSVQKGAAQAE
ncbi:unnamed protein product (macronuclear) [Paramecium tetraurelia]|uniref:Large ribosomal subunit protein uL4 n=1 Tax=Paramecium tetraurelia TaxID=5888 RepID=Q3SEA6_PARTE|nr:uncharacterized protein GSPATT00033610001 [Paramecium tetraurelia]XP_001458496.1 uncharacterized protein GSPATT00023827001 [Paramecium tetraurelia]CAI39016.1 telomerase, putative [Paramecium tetraurelia]CAI39018.1 ribosomal protein L4, putative [Paramecium tetraurelia]CAK63757.1 unnamed protein product [Paramecium tetraurelia]CAK91099.1 unnamed protein product [Paramecium tetraurelia]|eukprot:XP_001431155.1 hypothetical protein (macronuclear) [Paramecium tetraurelia strain d4-2]